MTSSPIAYARAAKGDDDGEPLDWFKMEVIDAETGERLLRVLEANAAEGWFVEYRTHPDGRMIRTPDGQSAQTFRVERPIIIRPKAATEGVAA